MKEISMKTVSNVMAGVGIAIVIGSFVLNACGLTRIAMTEALMAGGFARAYFYRSIPQSGLTIFLKERRTMFGLGGVSIGVLGGMGLSFGLRLSY